LPTPENARSQYWAAFFYAWAHGVPGSDLPPITLPEQVVIALMTQAVMVPLQVRAHVIAAPPRPSRSPSNTLAPPFLSPAPPRALLPGGRQRGVPLALPGAVGGGAAEAGSRSALQPHVAVRAGE
jgi:hypothetical protein